MRKIPIAAALLTTIFVAPVYAQDAATPAATPAPAASPAEPAAAPAQSAMPSAAPAQSAAMQSEYTGQTIYSSKGTKIGTVTAVTTDAQGQQQAVVGVEKFLGLGGKNVMFPVSSLQAKSGGGYTTSLTSSEIKALPEAH
ncbi:MAG TPA: PRC-barrel domain-containing protein [Rhizomicrobium sp.]|nr:PRC-barrel domain-containing protein [Rhizomicrobium sp.]